MAPIFKRVAGSIGNLRCLVKGVALCVAGPLLAEVTQPCPPLQVEAVCKGGAVEAVTLRPPRGVASNLSFAVTSQDKGGVTGDKAHLLSGNQSMTLPVKGGAFTLAVLGLESQEAADNSACCFSNQTVGLAGLCAETGAPDEAVEPVLPDVAIGLEMSESCNAGTCAGVLTLTGDVPEQIQLSLTIAPAIVRDVQAGGGLRCEQTGGAVLCDWAKPAQAELVFRIPRSQPEGVLEICAQTGVAAEPRLRAMALQAALNAKGYDAGKVDGLIGPATRSALAQMKADEGITGEEMLPEAALRALGLSDFVDANPQNNRMCATTLIPKPPLVCDKRSTVQSGEACLCRLRNMVRVSERACACPKGTVASGGACVKRKQPQTTPRPKKPAAATALVCDRKTTVQRGTSCACRYSGMRKVSATKCRCSNGLPALPGVGCVNVTLSLPGGGDKP